ncbi:MAG: flavin reductase [Saprospiraceae bacterium]|nr:flavin reductase [Saprospiraceae bacterium]
MGSKDLKRLSLVELDVNQPVWPHFFTVAPLILVGTREKGGYDLAPKHMATPLGHDNYFGFVCTPRHGTYRNAEREKAFTVSFPRPEQVVLASLAASPRCGDERSEKPVIDALPTVMAPQIDAPFIVDGYLFFECQLDRIVDGFGEYSLICGQIIGAYVDEDSHRSADRSEQEMIFQAPLLAYLANGRFAKIDRSNAFPFPAGFKI